MSMRRLVFSLATATLLFSSVVSAATELLNVSYDPTRELYQQYNAAFIRHWKETTGESITIRDSHGGSGKQARAVIDGLQADVVTLALAGDIDALNLNRPLIDPQWQSRLPDNSTPYTSTIVFLVRKGNPKHIKDWNDLIKPGVEVITPNPKTSGGARWNFLAAWAYAKHLPGGNDESALKFVTELYRHAPVLDTGARGATVSFVQRQLGDVLIAWENEAHLALKEQGGDQLEIITPSLSILAEPPVAVVDKVVERKGTQKLAEAYLRYLYSDEGQRIIAENYYRPRNAQIAEEFKNQFAPVQLVTIDKEFGGWKKAQSRFFNDGGVFDSIFKQINK
ncbi:sulfate ABC transporter substrate-binding protein [Pectobacteriaceae bacterium CE70]|uniref:Sulfate ABC transporter substrate-binding protein n=1 Tax=Serratia sp. (strain ATCC 39006) TaxID=104623 RepID=A0A2I5TI18_SERS3|nr:MULTISPECIES: sulfate ABC transporter substrate-binding protein [Enterobacterales]WJV57225.1 sulfate ABC transporter substrate-binding protein [Pectobacteriaceae bacterium C111]WJV61599.1 sulfate ABC transporter substrate-binding protein [Pectobacteriaceae bacterium C52]WJV65874.1 sulfate ABC transporter substrate-binding protein [Pectobacteriaceae bacterium CE70]WJY09893.1 sulfate ABC transporter substrate-binding protein [Pectobacteriaceae bacterium C80]WJY16095.1 sulfate ABC transporter 